MKNHKILGVDGKEYYIHRNIGVAGFLFRYYEGNLQVLANQRGSGTSNHNYLWNCPCGFLDYDETLKMACIREIQEECKFIIDSNKISCFEINDSLTSYSQNVSHRFYALLNKNDSINEIGIGTEGELNEINDVKWINIQDINNYKWAFNHDYVIHSICLKKFKLGELYQLYNKIYYRFVKVLKKIIIKKIYSLKNCV